MINELVRRFLLDRSETARNRHDITARQRRAPWRQRDARPQALALESRVLLSAVPLTRQIMPANSLGSLQATVATTLPFNGSQALGSTAYDTATVTGPNGDPTPTGTLTYDFYATATPVYGTTTPVSTQTVTLSSGAVPNANTTAALAAGSYAYIAVYNGDGNYATSTGSVESFAIIPGTASVSSSIYNASNNQAVTGNLALGSAVYDTSTLAGVTGFTPTGTLTYYFYNSASPTYGVDTPVSTQTVNLSSGAAPDSSATAALGGGAHSFIAVYSGDSNYYQTTGAAEPVTINKGTPTVATVIDNASTSQPITTDQAVGVSVNDTATVTGLTGFTPSGSLTYYFYDTSTPVYGTTTPVSTQSVNLNDGAVPNSSTASSLAAGNYAYIGVYASDSNYNQVVGAAEILTVKYTSAISTTIYNTYGSPVYSDQTLGTSIYDSGTVASSDGGPYTPTGTITFYYYNTATPVYGTTTPASSFGLSLSSGSGNSSASPARPGAGVDSFIAVYGGDSHYLGSIGSVESFTIDKGTTTASTTVDNASTKQAINGAQNLGVSVQDAASIQGSAAPNFQPGGSVTYYFYNTLNPVYGVTTPIGTDTESVSGGSGLSAATAALGAGNYAYIAVYAGDSNYTGSTGQAEPFIVNQGTPTLSTTVDDASNNQAVTANLTLGSAVYDTATVGGPLPATGTLTYYFYKTATPVYGSTNPVSSQAVTLSSGAAPQSPNTASLGGGNYSYIAVYSGDSNYFGVTGSIETLTVNPATATVSATIINNQTGQPLSGNLAYNAVVFDTASVTGADAAQFPAGGTLTYYFYNTATPVYGTTTPFSTDTVSVVSGVVPNSSLSPSLASGSYAYIPVYNGDANYQGFTGAIQSFSVAKSSASISATIDNAATNQSVTSALPLGASVFDTAMVSGSPSTPTGSVTYNFYNTASPIYGATTPLTTETVTLSNGTVPNATPSSPLAAGSYAYIAVYSGDSSYNGAIGTVQGLSVHSGSATVANVIDNAASNLAVTASLALGASVYDTATVTGPFTPSGSLTYYFYATAEPIYGTTTPISTQTVTLGSGLAPNSSATASLAAGVYSYIAVYGGDANYSSGASTVQSVTISRGASSIATTADNAATNQPITASQPLGTSAYDTATITAAPFTPTGTVTYYFYNTASPVYGTTTPISAQTVTISNGLAVNSAATASLAVGGDAFIAVYSGDSNYTGAVGSIEALTISQAAATVGTTIENAANSQPLSSQEPLGVSVLDSASVNGPFAPTGTVTYYFYNTATPIYGTTTPLSSQTVTLSNGAVPNSTANTSLAVGSYAYIAVYSGDGNYLTTVGSVEALTISQTAATVSTTIDNAANSQAINGNLPLDGSVLDTATITGGTFTPTGTLTYYFYNSATPIYGTTTPISTQTVTLSSGKAPNSSATGDLPAGSYAFIAVYNGDGNYAASVGAVEPLTISQGSVTFSATIDNAATNSAVTAALPLGSSVYGGASVTGLATTPTGTVTWYFYNVASPTYGTTTPLSTQTVTLSGGAVPNSSPTAALAAGSYAYIGVYNGDSSYASNVGSVESLTVNRGVSSVSTTVDNSATTQGIDGNLSLGSSVYDTATVTASPFTPTGTLTYFFYAAAAPVYGTTVPFSTQTVSLSAGLTSNSLTTASLAAGGYAFIAVYNGDSNYVKSVGSVEAVTINSGSATVDSTIDIAATNQPVTTSLALGNAVYDTATITGGAFTPTGTLTYYFYNTAAPVYGTTTPLGPQAVTLSNGEAPNSSTTIPLAAGTYAYIAVYSGDGNYASAIGSAESLTINQGTASVNTTAYSASNPVTGSLALGASVSDTATITGGSFTPTGTLTYYFYNTAAPVYGTTTPVSSQTVNLNFGNVPSSASTLSLAAGSYAFIAVYNGDGNYQSSSSAILPLTVNTATAAINTSIYNAGTNTFVSGNQLPGISVYDTATVSGRIAPTGTLTYYFYDTTAPVYGSTTPVSSQTVSLSGGIVPTSSATGALAVGSYAFIAVYSGDSNYAGPAVGIVEPLTVAEDTAVVSTAIYNASTSQPVGVSPSPGVSLYDTATVTGPVTPTGTLTYYFYNTATPVYGTTTPVSTQTVNLSGGIVPSSSATGSLAAGGNYAYIAVYSGDADYTGPVVGAVESITIGAYVAKLTTGIYNGSTFQPVTANPSAGVSVYDTAVLSGPVIPTGSLTYYFYNTASPTFGVTTPVSTDTVPLSNGVVPNSLPTGALAIGNYAFIAVYSGDSNYAGPLVGAAETLTVAKSKYTATFSSTVDNASTHKAISGAQALGISVDDTATVSGPVTPTGTVTYYFYNTTTPVYGTTTPISSQTVTLSNGAVPSSTPTGALAASGYAFIAVYSGDSNFNSAVGAVQPLTINKGSATLTASVYNASTHVIISGSQPVGISVYDSVTLTGPLAPTGTITYYFYNTAAPVYGTTTAITSSKVTLSNGAAPISSTLGALVAGGHAFVAVYSGDSNYSSSIGAVQAITVVSQVTPTIKLSILNITYGTALTNAQLSGTATAIVNGAAVNVPGTFSYTSAAGTMLGVSNNQTEAVTFKPTNTSQFATVSGTVTINVAKAVTIIHAADDGGAYTGSAYPASGYVAVASTGASIATPVYTYYLASDKTHSHPLAGAPSSPGNYVFLATFAGNADYLPFTTSAPFNISIAVKSLAAASMVFKAGVSFSGTVATFTAPAGLPTSDFSATITWGDGATSTAVVVLGAKSGQYVITASHTYPKTGTYKTAITLTPAGSTALTATGSAT